MMPEHGRGLSLAVDFSGQWQVVMSRSSIKLRVFPRLCMQAALTLLAGPDNCQRRGPMEILASTLWLMGLLSSILAVQSFAFANHALAHTISREGESKAVSTPAIIPAPKSLEVKEGMLTLPKDFVIEVRPASEGAKRIAAYLIELLERTSSFAPKLAEPGGEGGAGTVMFHSDHAALGKEAYRLSVSNAGVDVRAGTSSGLFYGAVTLWQILSSTAADAEIETGQGMVALPHFEIADAPSFPWRGLMLDSARHFQPPAFVKQLIEWMALHKLNTLHWHLTDDQGWRLEIKKYPRLTAVGAWRVPARAEPATDVDPETGQPLRYGGFYTQAEVREIVAFARERFVTIVPEIEMPGHAQAAIVAYPELGVQGMTPSRIASDWGVFPYLFNVEEETFAFLQDVLREVMALFPGDYVHIGGDEAQKAQWKSSPRIQRRMQELGIQSEDALQGYFTRRMDEFLTTHDRRLIGWDEILEGGLSPNAVVMSWRGVDGAIEAAKKGHDAILSPAPTLYFDHRQGGSGTEPPGRGAVITMEDVYRFDPRPDALSETQAARIKGVQANIWTEHIRTTERVEHMAFPRAAALAEVAWSPSAARNWRGFLKRLAAFLPRYESLGISYAISAFRPRVHVELQESLANPYRVLLSSQAGLGRIRYTIDDGAPAADTPAYTAPFTITPPARLRAATFHDGRRLSPIVDRELSPHGLLARPDHRMKLCSEKLVLYLEDDAPLDGRRAIYLVDILDPCWIFEDVPLDHVGALEVRVGQVPFNFQVGEAVDAIPLRTPMTPGGELQARAGDCETGDLIASLPLAPARKRAGVTRLRGEVAALEKTVDVCFTFAADKIDPLWVIDHVQFVQD